MTHQLRKPCPDNPMITPLVFSMRYQCACANREVINIQVVLDMEMLKNEKRYISWVTDAMWRDMQREIEQHIAKAKE